MTRTNLQYNYTASTQQSRLTDICIQHAASASSKRYCWHRM